MNDTNNLILSTARVKCDERKLYGTQGCIGILPLKNPKLIINCMYNYYSAYIVVSLAFHHYDLYCCGLVFHRIHVLLPAAFSFEKNYY